MTDGSVAPGTRKLIGPPHAHWDAPCTDACYELDSDAPLHTCVIGVPDADHPLRTDSAHCARCADGAS